MYIVLRPSTSSLICDLQPHALSQNLSSQGELSADIEHQTPSLLCSSSNGMIRSVQGVCFRCHVGHVCQQLHDLSSRGPPQGEPRREPLLRPALRQLKEEDEEKEEEKGRTGEKKEQKQDREPEK